MTTMIERVARAMCLEGSADETVFLGVYMKRWETKKDYALAAIEAMRKHTPEMDSAGYDAYPSSVSGDSESISKINGALEKAAQIVEVNLTTILTSETVAGRMLHHLDGKIIREIASFIRDLKVDASE